MKVTCGIEDGDRSALVAIAAGIVAVGGPERRGGLGDVGNPLAQGWLVVLDLDDQGDAGSLPRPQSVFLTGQGIEGDDGAVSDAKLGEQRLGCRDFIGFVGDVDVRENEGGLGGSLK